jgi:hypothetical protein
MRLGERFTQVVLATLAEPERELADRFVSPRERFAATDSAGNP